MSFAFGRQLSAPTPAGDSVAVEAVPLVAVALEASVVVPAAVRAPAVSHLTLVDV